MHIIQLYIYKFLQDIKDKPYKIPEELLTKFGSETQKALQKQFEREARDFKLSMSNVGRPLCQLEYASLGVKGTAHSDVVRNLYGDLCEDVILFLLHASGVKVLSELQRVSLTIEGVTLNGEYDVILDLGDGPSVWDIKSASEWAFKNKFTDVNFDKFVEEDTYGYVAQLFLYARATQTKAGGWIIINKSSGEIRVVAVPTTASSRLQEHVSRTVSYSIIRLSSNEHTQFKNNTKEFVSKYKLFAIPETFKGKPTGNNILPYVCTQCEFREKCWPNAVLLPQALSKAKDPKLVWYEEKCIK